MGSTKVIQKLIIVAILLGLAAAAYTMLASKGTEVVSDEAPVSLSQSPDENVLPPLVPEQEEVVPPLPENPADEAATQLEEIRKDAEEPVSDEVSPAPESDEPSVPEQVEPDEAY